jgi:hypothetical protein
MYWDDLKLQGKKLVVGDATAQEAVVEISDVMRTSLMLHSDGLSVSMFVSSLCMTSISDTMCSRKLQVLAITV